MHMRAYVRTHGQHSTRLRCAPIIAGLSIFWPMTSADGALASPFLSPIAQATPTVGQWLSLSSQVLTTAQTLKAPFQSAMAAAAPFLTTVAADPVNGGLFATGGLQPSMGCTWLLPAATHAQSAAVCCSTIACHMCLYSQCHGRQYAQHIALRHYADVFVSVWPCVCSVCAFTGHHDWRSTGTIKGTKHT